MKYVRMFKRFPTCLEAMWSLRESDLREPADTAALVLCALDVYSENKKDGAAIFFVGTQEL